MEDSYILEYLDEPVVQYHRGKGRTFDWAIRRENETLLEEPNSIVFLFGEFTEAQETYDRMIK